jgi:hypothetical protein
MGTQIQDIVKVTLTSNSYTPQKDAYKMLLIVGKNPIFESRYKLYASRELATLLTDLDNDDTTLEYLAATIIAMQEPRPTYFAVGRVGSAETYTEALNAILIENSNFYGVIGATRDVAEQEDIADWVSVNKRICAFATAGTLTDTTNDLLDETDGTDDSSLAFYLKDLLYRRATCIYHADALTNFIDAGFLSVALQKRPGTYTMCEKKIIGATPDKVDTTQAFNVHAKNANLYETIGDNNILTFSKMGDGNYFDMVVWLDWLETQLTNAEMLLLLSNDKIDFTDEGGIAQIENSLNAVLKIEQQVGAITPDSFDVDGKQNGGYSIYLPDYNHTLQNDRLLRVYKGIEIHLWYNHPIHSIEVNVQIV